MGQQWTTWIVVMSGLLVLFYFNGLITEPPTLLKIMLDPSGPEFIDLGIQLTLAFTAAVVLSSISIGFFTIQKSDIAITAVFMGFIYNLAQGYTSVYNALAESSPVFAVLIFSPMVLLFIFIIFDFWRGRD